MTQGIGNLRDDEVALISNLVARVNLAQEAEQKFLGLTMFEMDVVAKMGLVVLSKEAGRESVPLLTQRVDELEKTLLEIAEAQPKRGNIRTLITEIREKARQTVGESEVLE